VRDGCKLIDVHSALILKSKLTTPVDVRIELPEHRKSVDLPVLQPGASIAVPVHLAAGVLKVKPHGWGCQWSSKGLWWEHYATPAAAAATHQVGIGLACRTILDGAAGEDKAPFRCCVSVFEEPYPATLHPCPGHTLTLLPPLIVENLLPCALEFLIVGSTAAGGDLAAGESKSLYAVDLQEDLRLTVRINGFQWSEPALVSDPGNSKKADSMIRVRDEQGRELLLLLSNQLKRGSGGARTVAVLAPYWILNHTGLPLEYKQANRPNTAAGQRETPAERRYGARFQTNNCTRGCHWIPRMFACSSCMRVTNGIRRESTALSVGTINYAQTHCRSPDPFLFSCDDETNKSNHNKCQLRVGNRSDWGPDVAIDVVGRAGTLRIKELDTHGPNAKVYEFGVMVNRGQGRFYPTKIISILPRHVIVNSTTRIIQIVQAKVLGKVEQLDAGSSQPYHWPRPKEQKRMSIRFSDRACTVLFHL
jgi:vacuolar protein sorting-associated protein 13A/C